MPILSSRSHMESAPTIAHLALGYWLVSGTHHLYCPKANYQELKKGKLLNNSDLCQSRAPTPTWNRLPQLCIRLVGGTQLLKRSSTVQQQSSKSSGKVFILSDLYQFSHLCLLSFESIHNTCNVYFKLTIEKCQQSPKIPA